MSRGLLSQIRSVLFAFPRSATVEDLHLPGVVHDREAMLASLRRLRVLRDAGAKIYYGHDPEQWREISRPPEAVGF